jgi:hypothetical protein
VAMLKNLAPRLAQKGGALLFSDQQALATILRGKPMEEESAPVEVLCDQCDEATRLCLDDHAVAAALRSLHLTPHRQNLMHIRKPEFLCPGRTVRPESAELAGCDLVGHGRLIEIAQRPSRPSAKGGL